MKTVRYNHKHGGHVARLSDMEAYTVVAKGVAVYCPKHWLKAALSAEKDEQQ